MPDDQAAHQARNHHDLADEAGALGLEPIDQHAVHHAQQRARQHRHRHHEALLGGTQAEIGDICTASGPSITQTMKLMSK